MRRLYQGLPFVFAILLLVTVPIIAQQDDEIPRAEVVNDEGGAILITGTVTYTNLFFTAGVAMPVVILEDQAGFVDRNRYYLMPVESQTLGQITSDFYTSPFTYSLSMPIVPQGAFRDVDQDDSEDIGIQVFAVAYWTNTWGDPYLEERDLYGGGWSSAYASTRVSDNVEDEYEIVGGKFVVYAPDDEQGFPSGFGDDGLLFTEDDPIVLLPEGVTVVDLDTDPFTFDRSREVAIDLIEPEGAALDDFSSLSYPEAFDAMVDLFRKEYAYTEFKNMDWDELHARFRPEFEAAEDNNDQTAYVETLRNFYLEIPDGHMMFPLFPQLVDRFVEETDGGLGIAIRELDDGRVITNFVLPGSPAADEGIELGAEILGIDGVPIDQAVSEAEIWAAPYSTEHFGQLQRLRYVTRFLVGAEVKVTYLNPGDDEPTTVFLTAVPERESFAFSSFNVGLTGYELPLEYEVLESGYVYAKIYSFFDNELLTIQLWERMIQTMNENSAPGLIIDMRQNGGGSGFLADQMAAYFFDEALVIGNTGIYDEEVGDFYFDPRGAERMYLPAENLRYHGDIALLIGPNCSSACEFFSHNMTIQDRAAIVGQYPTGGLGGGQKIFAMPDGIRLQFSIGRNVDAEGNIIIEGTGVVPTVQVPVTEDTLLTDGDPILDYAVAYLDDSLAPPESSSGGDLALGESVEGELTVEAPRAQFTLSGLSEDMVLDFLAEGDFEAYLRIYVVANNNALALESAFPVRELDIPADLELIVEVGSENDDAVGSFVLTVQESVPVEWEPEDAGAIEIGDTVTGELSEGVRFRYTLEIADDAVLDFLLGDDSGELDTYLRIYEEGDLDEPLYEIDDIDPGVERNSLLEGVEVSAGQVLVVEVAGFGDYNEGAYFLTVTESEQ